MRSLKTLALVVVLCSGAIACNPSDTREPKEWPRLVEPRLTGAQWRACSGRECGEREPSDEEPCPASVPTHSEALQVLATQPQCTDNAIAALEEMARTDVRALNDLAAAYYLRAGRDDRPSDLLQALQTAQDAAARTQRRNPAALFNLALIQERLQLTGLARQTWEEVEKLDHSDWAKEARERKARLRVPETAARWRRRLRTALESGDGATVRAMSDANPGAVLEYLNTAKIEPFRSELLQRLGADHVRAQELNLQAYTLDRASRYLEALHAYDSALNIFIRVGDVEKIGSVRRNRAGVYHAMGHLELSWREALDAMQLFAGVVNARRRQGMIVEIVRPAKDLGYPHIALLYTDMAVALLHEELREIPPAEVAEISEVLGLIASARRLRAEIALELDREELAQRELAEALRLTEGALERGDELAKTLRVRMHQVRGRSLLALDPNAASRAFTQALNDIAPHEMKTLRAELYAARAEAERRAGRSARADLQQALRELREEESRLLQPGARAEGERYWSAYFRRFENTYDLLIRHLFEAGEWKQAFDYDERSRGYEPLDLILDRGVAPPAFRRLVPGGEPMNLDAVSRQLPPDTALLQYAVMDDHTYTWIVRREGARAVRQTTTRDQVTRWREQMQRAIRQRDPHGFHLASISIFNGLLARPLDEVWRWNPKARIVIVPDRSMHGLPFAAAYDSRSGRYLIEAGPVEIGGSATLYVFSRLRDAALPRDARQSVLLVADPAFAPSALTRRLTRLPRARHEVAQIEGMYEADAEVATLAAEEATAERFFALARNRTLLHVAGHALVNPNEPWRSVLLLAKSTDHDGAVEARELVERLSLDRTRLVVLAACHSAGGHPIGPEGVSPLVRPLITAGVPAVVGSLWDVEDTTAEGLSVSFHRRYEQGMDAAQALQAAQRDMLRSEGHDIDAVMSWAPFQVIGHASSPFEPTH